MGPDLVAESVLLATIFLAGLTAGSFVNVVIFRGPVLWKLVEAPPRGDLARPRSYCPACKTTLGVGNLIPILSFAIQQGRCSSCDAKIPIRYPIVEGLGGAVALLSVAMFGWSMAALLAAIAALMLIALAFIDLETGYLPDALTFPLAGLGLCASLFGMFASLTDALIGASAGFLIFWVIGAIYRHLRKREGLGLGDAKLLAAIGAWTGWFYLPMTVLSAAVVTLVFALARRGATSDDAAPFGPGLCAAGFAALFFGEYLFTGL